MYNYKRFLEKIAYCHKLVFDKMLIQDFEYLINSVTPNQKILIQILIIHL